MIQSLGICSDTPIGAKGVSSPPQAQAGCVSFVHVRNAKAFVNL